MKPIKNKIYCPGCKRTKILFETEKKARTFIKFNQKEILEETGYAPIRVYYCKYCGGYHTTSSGLVPLKKPTKRYYTGPLSPFVNTLRSKKFLDEAIRKSLWSFSCQKAMGKYNHLTKVRSYVYNFLGNLYTPEMKIDLMSDSYKHELKKYSPKLVNVIRESREHKDEPVLETIFRLMGGKNDEVITDISALRYRGSLEMSYNILQIRKYGDHYQLSILKVSDIDKNPDLQDFHDKDDSIPIITLQGNCSDVKIKDDEIVVEDWKEKQIPILIYSLLFRHLTKPEGNPKELVTDERILKDFKGLEMYSADNWPTADDITDSKTLVPGQFRKQSIGKRREGNHRWTFVKPFLRSSKNRK